METDELTLDELDRFIHCCWSEPKPELQKLLNEMVMQPAVSLVERIIPRDMLPETDGEWFPKIISDDSRDAGAWCWSSRRDGVLHNLYGSCRIYAYHPHDSIWTSLFKFCIDGRDLGFFDWERERINRLPVLNAMFRLLFSLRSWKRCHSRRVWTRKTTERWIEKNDDVNT